MSVPRKIAGVAPGQLDVDQPSRILRSPNAKLHFASYDPHTASFSARNINTLSLNDETRRPKRIVVETLPSGESFWRFVPNARRQSGVNDEGSWPRVIRICDELIECSQDQWDLYKLDSKYDCYVPLEPEVTTISIASIIEEASPIAGPSNHGKRNISPESPGRATSPRQSPAKRPAFESKVFDVAEESDEEMMTIDGTRTKPLSSRAKKLKELNRQERREKISRRNEKLATQDGDSGLPMPLDSDYHSYFAGLANTFQNKRKANLRTSLNGRSRDDTDLLDNDEGRSSNMYTNAKSNKRARTTSPLSAKRDLEAKRLERERRKKERREQQMRDRRKQRDERFMQEVLNALPPDAAGSSSNAQNGADVEEMDDSDIDEEEEEDEGEEEEIDEEAARIAAIEESRRKLAQLEADRPLWEAAARERIAREQAEEKARREEAEARRQAQARIAEERRRAAQREEAEKKRREEANWRRQQEEAARLESDKRKRQQQRFAYGTWTPQRALERYKALCESFDTTKYTPNQQPLTFDLVPWPVLRSPLSLTVEDVDWAAVEKFFEVVRPHMRTQDFKILVEKSHKRFHPDRWRSRGLLTSILDEEERGCIEVATNTVAQALTPIWISLKGK